MQLNYRGQNYTVNGAHQSPISKDGVTARYRGIPYQLQYSAATASRSIAELAYRGIRYQDN